MKNKTETSNQDKPYMCEKCKDFYKTKTELLQHAQECHKEGEMSKDQLLNENVSKICNYVIS